MTRRRPIAGAVVRLVAAVVVASGGFVVVAARAQPAKPAEDLAKAAVRKAAEPFLTALADGDAAKARALFAADDAAAKVALDEYLATVASVNRFRAAMLKLGAEEEWLKIGAGESMRRKIRSLEWDPITVDEAGGAAAIAGGLDFDRGLWLTRADAASPWRVAAISSNWGDDRPRRARLRAERVVFDNLAAAVARGEYKTWDAAMRELGESLAIAAPVPEVREGRLPREREAILEPSDARAASLRMAARAFLIALRDGDADRARAGFVGDEAEGKVLDALLKGVESTKRFRAAMRAKFGADMPDIPGVGIDTDIGEALLVLPVVVTSMSNTTGSTSPGAGLVSGLEFAREGDRWRISALTSISDTPAARLRRVEEWTAALDQAAADVTAGRLATPDAVAAFLSQKQAAAEVGSSRVDLQACKLEYSIVSPK